MDGGREDGVGDGDRDAGRLQGESQDGQQAGDQGQGVAALALREGQQPAQPAWPGLGRCRFLLFAHVVA